MKFDLESAIAILERTPEVLTSMLLNLPEEWTSKNEGGESWNAFDVVGHLIHGEKTDWMARAKIILSTKTEKPFETFDRFAQFEASKGKTLTMLLAEFKALRAVNIRELRALNITGAELELTGTHPVFGKVTLSQLLSTWVVHDLNHIAQISRVMAKQYKEEVGPWIQYLGILQK